jgi:hypothetical protein
VVGPVTNDRTLPQANERSLTPNNGKADSQGGAETQGTPASQRPADDQLNVSGAARLASQEVNRSPGNVQTREQAASLASRISEQIRELGSQALQAQGGIGKERATGILEAMA